MQAAQKAAPNIGVSAACISLGVSRATEYRRRHPQRRPAILRAHPNALNEAERSQVLATLSSARFMDSAPAAVYATLLDEEKYLCSTSTMYRILRAHQAVRERRAQRRRPVYSAPQLVARRPNEVWSWDITKLLSTRKMVYYHLYVMLDIYSRYVVGWLLADRECGALAEILIEDCCAKQAVTPGTVTIHSDNGPAMISKPVVELHHRLDLTKSLSRPYTSNDNPFSEAQFKTMKYRPNFEKRSASIEDSRTMLRAFFPWYNTEHRHSGIAYMTPAAVHYGRTEAIQEKRRIALDAAYATHPNRFFHGKPTPFELPTAVWINPPCKATEESAMSQELLSQGNEIYVGGSINLA